MTTSADHRTNYSITVEDDRTGLSVDTLQRALADNLLSLRVKLPNQATKNDLFLALAYTVRDRMIPGWLNTYNTYLDPDTRVVTYLSAEYLLGPHLGKNLVNLDIYDNVKQAVELSGLDLADLEEHEEEPGLGNGGLGRLAAAYMDSLAMLQIPAIGYGIRYEFGIFDQEIRDGWQVEVTDKWLQPGNPWELQRPEHTVSVQFGGHTEPYTDDQGRYRVRWYPDQVVLGVPCDTPIAGYHVNTVNTLRLWRAEACKSFDLQAFNTGDYYGAVDQKVYSENLTKVLYPNDEPVQGKRLRLEQEYFLVSCSLQDMLRMHLQSGQDIHQFADKFAAQLNDTHPALAVPELMRLLLDEHGMAWDSAWDITCRTFGFTNHTLLPEAMEKWPLDLLGSLLPRHLEIIFEINFRFLSWVRVQSLADPGKLAQLSLIDESGERYVRMANLACVGSHAINGVSNLHTNLLQQDVLKDFYELWPEKFSNKTNGITPRRWLLLSNPRLTDLIQEKIGKGWAKDLEQLRSLEPLVEDAEFRQRWHDTQQAVKADLAQYIRERLDLDVNPSSLFDVHVKRIHQYKRQHLKVLHIITLYQQLRQNPDLDIVPRTFIFSGKAAPSYFMAKLIIKLINAVGKVVNNDPAVRDRMKVVFVPDYNVKTSQHIYPAADLSEQISMAGKEASGTGNMKFMLNGALTIGTYDGANVEIREQAGAENFFLFGLQVEEIQELKAQGYHPRDYYEANESLRGAIDLIQSGLFSEGDQDLFRPLIDTLLNDDPFMLLADYQSYIDCQAKVDEAFRDRDRWTRMSILNTARVGIFSADRAIRQYCEDIWHTHPVPIEVGEYSQDGVRQLFQHR